MFLSPNKLGEKNTTSKREGPFMLAMRYSLPKPELLDGNRKSPVVQKAD